MRQSSRALVLESRWHCHCHASHMSLAAAHESRKERLEALRRRKDGTETDGFVYSLFGVFEPCPPNCQLASRKPFVFKQRNYDPETRTVRKRAIGEGEEDTVETAVEGLAAKIIAEDEERRAQDLVRAHGLPFYSTLD